MLVKSLFRIFRPVMAGIVAVMIGTPALAQKAQASWEEARRIQLEAARREGIPTTLKDLRGNPVPADQNAAAYITKIVELDKVAPVSQDEITALEDVKKLSPTPDQIAKGRQALEAHRERLRLIHLAAQCPFYSEPPKTFDVSGVTMPDNLPQNARFREYARWLVAESMLQMLEGHPLEAVQVDTLVFSLARQVASSGSLISYLVGQAIDSIALGGLRLILYREGQTAAVAEAIRKAIETQRSAPDLARVLHGEVVSSLMLTESLRRNIPRMLKGEPGDTSQPPFEKTAEYRTWTKKFGYPTDPKLAAARYLDMNEAHYLAWMRRILPLVDLPYPESRSGIMTILQEAEKSTTHPDYASAAIMVPLCETLPAHKARSQAAAEMVHTGAALLAWKAGHGHFPESLAECLTPVPPDPFDLHPLRYRREGEGFVLYSVGESGKFDGGRPDQKPRSGETLFRYPLPAYAH